MKKIIFLLIINIFLFNGCTNINTNNLNIIKTAKYEYKRYDDDKIKWKLRKVNGYFDGKQFKYNKKGQIIIIEEYNMGNLKKVSLYPQSNNDTIKWKNRMNEVFILEKDITIDDI